MELRETSARSRRVRSLYMFAAPEAAGSRNTHLQVVCLDSSPDLRCNTHRSFPWAGRVCILLAACCWMQVKV